MSSYYQSSKSVVVHNDRYLYPRQPSADSSYSRSSTGSSAYHSSTMPTCTTTTSSGSSSQASQTYRSGDSKDGIKTTSSKGKVTVVNHNGSRSWDKYDPHPEYRR